VPYEQFPVSVVVMIRGDWLDALGLKVPKTIEQYEKVVQAFKDKYNDEGYVPLWSFIHDTSFVGAYVKNGQQNYLDADGKIKPYFLDPGYKDMLAKMAEWYKKGYLHKEIATMSYQQATDTFDSGRSGEMMNWLKSIEMNEKLLTDKVPQGRLIGLPPLSRNQPGMYGSDLPSGWGTVITSSSKNPEAAMTYINWSAAVDDGYLVATYGLEGSQWNWKDKANGIINFVADKDKVMGGAGDESPFNTGILAYYAGKFATSLRDKDFMNWLNGPEVRSQFPVDLGVNYDVDSMAGKDKFGAIGTLIDEARWKIIVGEQPVSSWDDAVKSWLKEGGEEWIAGYTAQYKVARGK
jgi:ABC-type glycerol-3-phosphate transport system substrate-binding protein